MNALITLLLSGIVVAISSYVIPGVTVENFLTAIVVAVVLGIVNAVIKPILVVLTLPINLLTLGLFTFIINALMVMLAGAIVPGFTVDGLLAALLFSIVVSLVGAVIGSMSGKTE